MNKVIGGPMPCGCHCYHKGSCELASPEEQAAWKKRVENEMADSPLARLFRQAQKVKEKP